jgi:hypothetical protein
MGMPTEPLLDIMRRSMANLKFVEEHAQPSGPYEVTQLVNTFLGALAHPFDAMRNDLMVRPLADAAILGWPSIAREQRTDREPSSLGDLIRLMRNAIAHGNIEFLSDEKGQISSIRVWNNDRGVRTWGAILSVEHMRTFLCRFVELVERRHKDFGWYMSGAA